jgi:DNA polymerase III alpha subunit
MNYDKFGRAYVQSDELADMLYQDPNLNLNRFFVVDPEQYNNTVQRMYLDYEHLQEFKEIDPSMTIEQFDQALQEEWKMPQEYLDFDIAQWLLDQCKTDAELQRVGEELLLYHERDLFNLLRYLKYMVDTFRKQKIVWGLGRGSSVASYVLYLIGVHKINSMYYDLDISEFLR